jgi:hypothetical protein
MKHKQSGYIILTLSLIVSGIGAAIAANLVLRATDDAQTGDSVNKAAKAQSLASACVEHALVTLKNHKSYGGDETVVVENGEDNTDGTSDDKTCRVLTVTGTGNTDRTIQTRARVRGTTKYKEAKVTEINPVLRTAYRKTRSDSPLLGEVRTFTQPSGSGGWQKVSFSSSYEKPVIVGLLNSENDSEKAMIFEARHVTSTSADVRLCESDTGNGCDSHGEETGGYMVVDATQTGNIKGIEAETFDTDGDVGSNPTSVSFYESFSSAPAVFGSVQSTNGDSPTAARVVDRSSSSFTAGICHQTSTDECDSDHASETVGWIALTSDFAPSIPFEINQSGTGIDESNWTSASFSSFSSAPVALVANQTKNGSQELQNNEARNITGSDMDFRYCELEGNTCDVHTTETVVWAAFGTGTLSTLNTDNPWRLKEDNLTLWLKASGLLQNDDSSVSEWIGHSNQELTVDQNTSADKPTFRTQSLNGRPTVEFDGDDLLSRSGTTLDTLVKDDTASVFAVQKQDGSSAENTTFALQPSGSSNRFLSYLDFNDTLYFDFGDTGSGGRISTPSPSGWDDTYHLVELFRDGSNGTIRVDNTTELSGTFSDTLDTSESSPLYVGTVNGNDSVFKGHIAEILVFDAALSDSEKSRIRNYLNIKYNLY